LLDPADPIRQHDQRRALIDPAFEHDERLAPVAAPALAGIAAEGGCSLLHRQPAGTSGRMERATNSVDGPVEVGVRVHLVNPSDLSFGMAVITPRWLFVLAAATPARFGQPHLVDESLERFEPQRVAPGDVIGISIHSGNALRGYAIGHSARGRGATVIFGGIHASLFPDEPREHGAASNLLRLKRACGVPGRRPRATFSGSR
jgi:hypothetical protein